MTERIICVMNAINLLNLFSSCYIVTGNLIDVRAQFTTDAHAGNITKIYGFYNDSCNVRHHASLPTDEPAMTRMVKVNEIKSMNKYFADLRPSKRSSR